MEKYLYKYLSFPSFVDIIQRKELHFVLPSEWEDTKESSFVYEWASNLDEVLSKFITILMVNRTYAQSWTFLSESDAMWRIYSYDNQSVRIKIDVSSIKKLEGVRMLRVEYSDKLIPYSTENLSHSEMILKYIAQKREAFKHENEVRLLYIDKIDENKVEPAIRNLYYFLMGEAGKTDDLDFSKIDLDELKEYINYTNICGDRPNHKVSFGHIAGFVEGVMVHPLAPEWYTDMVKMFCEINSIPFEGKSELYKGKQELKMR